MNDYILFAILSLPIVFFSKHTLFNPKAHGFHRFFAWECILWLVIKNIRYWFADAFSPFQITSWIFLLYALFLFIIGLIMLIKIGRPSKKRADKTIILFEKTTKLVETGLYRYIRHPLYGSLLFLNWGVYLKNAESRLLVVALTCTVFVFFTALTEEKENIRYFGDSYKKYIKKTKMFVPFIF